MAKTRTIYMKYVDKDGNISVKAHNVIDFASFLRGQDMAATVNGGSATHINEEQYRKLLWGDLKPTKIEEDL